MGRLIDASVLEKEFEKCNCDTSNCRLLVCPVYNQKIIEAIPKDQYEAKLRSDMVAMLTKIQLEIEELEPLASDSVGFDMCVLMSSDIIQQKINALNKENK
jgi:hypothetical protein